MDIILIIALVILAILLLAIVRFDRQFVELMHELLGANYKLTEKEANIIAELQNRVKELEEKIK